MMPIPVVISENGLGVPVTPVDGRAPVAVVAANGRGLPIVIAANATPMVIIGYFPGPDPGGDWDVEGGDGGVIIYGAPAAEGFRATGGDGFIDLGELQ